MSDRLFDPEPFSKQRRRYRDEYVKQPKPAAEVVTVALGATWRLFSGPEVHARRQHDVTMCGRVISAERIGGLTPLTFEPGTLASACLGCIANGAKP